MEGNTDFEARIGEELVEEVAQVELTLKVEERVELMEVEETFLRLV